MAYAVGLDGVDFFVHLLDVKGAIGSDGGGGMHIFPCFKFPFLGTSLAVQGADRFVIRFDVNSTIRPDGGHSGLALSLVLNYQYPIPWAVFDGCVAKLYSFPVRKRGRSGRGSFCYSVFGGMGLSPCSK